MSQVQLIECVPNFSEGVDMQVIKEITNEIEKINGVSLLNVDPGKATNRTVVTFVGEPNAVIEAAFNAIKKASEIIDMQKHKGEHPRMGATDVCPLIPIANISMEETAKYAHKLAQRVANELSIATYMYEHAQTNKSRNNLSVIRAGEYEGFFNKIKLPEWKPDYGKAEHNAKAGSTVIGARDFLIAYNVNLNTTSVRRANSIAFDIREAGRVMREGNSLTGKIINDEHGNPKHIPGKLKSVKAIGWFIKEFGVAQVSMNLTDMQITPLHIAFEESCKSADSRGLRVTGSELVGLVPLKAMLDAGKYFLQKQNRSTGISEHEIIHVAIKSMGLNEISVFKPEERIIEYVMQLQSKQDTLIKMDLISFANETASESPAPGGGSIAAYMGVLAASLGTMVANLSSHKPGWDDRCKEFSNWAEKGQALKNKLLQLVDADTDAFNQIMQAFGLPKDTEEAKQIRTKAIQDATKNAIEIPFKTLQLSYDTIDIAEAMVKIGNPNSVTDAGVAVLAARAAALGAYLNVKINASSYKDKTYVNNIIAKSEEIVAKCNAREQELWQLINSKINLQ